MTPNLKLPPELLLLIAAKSWIDMMSGELTALSDDHFRDPPDKIQWVMLATLNHYAGLLKRIQPTAPFTKENSPSKRNTPPEPAPAIAGPGLVEGRSIAPGVQYTEPKMPN